MAHAYTNENFEAEALSASGVVLVDFYADWCGPCQAMMPVIEELEVEGIEGLTIGKVDIDAADAIAAKYEVTSIPTFILLKDGEIVDKWMGVSSKDEIRERISNAS